MSAASTTIPGTSESDALRGRTISTKSLTTSGSLSIHETVEASNDTTEVADDSARVQHKDNPDDLPTEKPTGPLSDSVTQEATETELSAHTEDPSLVRLSSTSETTKTSWSTIASTLEACFGSEGDAAALTTKLREELDLPGNFPGLTLDGVAADGTEDNVLESAPSLMRAFVVHGEACSHAEHQALELAARDVDEVIQEEDPLDVYNGMLDTLEELDVEGRDLEDCISTLIAVAESEDDSPSSDPRSQIVGLFKACIPVLQARLSNVTMAQDLIDGVRENVSLTLRMEDLDL